MNKLILFSLVLTYQQSVFAGAEVENTLENNFLGQGVVYQSGKISIPEGYDHEGASSWKNEISGDDLGFYHNSYEKGENETRVNQTSLRQYGKSYYKDNRMVTYNSDGKIKSVISCKESRSISGSEFSEYRNGYSNKDGCDYYTPNFCKELMKMNLDQELESSELAACSGLLSKVGRIYGKEVENFNKDYKKLGLGFEKSKLYMGKDLVAKSNSNLANFDHKLSGADELLKNSLLDIVSDYQICKDNIDLFEKDSENSQAPTSPSSVKKD